MFNGTANPYISQANEDLQQAQSNQNFWNGVAAQFNPQYSVLQTPSSAPAYNKIAGNAQQMLAQASAIAPTGSNDLTAENRAISNTAGLTSRSEDLNNFLANLQGNQQSAEQREIGMFGNTENQNAKNNELNQAEDVTGPLDEAKTQQDIDTMWQQYNQSKPSIGNEIASGAGGLFGQFLGNQAESPILTMEANNPKNLYPETTSEQEEESD